MFRKTMLPFCCVLAVAAWDQARVVAEPLDDLRLLRVEISADDEALLRKLQVKRDIDADGATLAQFRDELMHQGIPVRFDERAFDEAGVELTQQLSFRRAMVTVIDALDTILPPRELDWGIRRGEVWITTRDESANSLVTHPYAVGRLFSSRFLGEGRQLDRINRDVEDLVDLIQASIEPDSWADAGGSGTIAPFTTRGERVLVVSQSERVHREIQPFLARLIRLGSPFDRPGEPSPAEVLDPPAQPSRLRTSRLRKTNLSRPTAAARAPAAALAVPGGAF